MKTLNFENTSDNFAGFTLSNDEMLKIRGGEGEVKPMPIPIKI